MIDDMKKATGLIEKMKLELPILAYPSKYLCKFAKERSNIFLNKKNPIEISDVMYGGEEAGIICDISKKSTKEVILVSLTHLCFEETYKLSKEIYEYQETRIRGMEIDFPSTYLN